MRFICSILFERFIHVIYRIFLKPLRTNRLRANTPEVMKLRVIPLPQ